MIVGFVLGWFVALFVLAGSLDIRGPAFSRRSEPSDPKARGLAPVDSQLRKLPSVSTELEITSVSSAEAAEITSEIPLPVVGVTEGSSPVGQPEFEESPRPPAEVRAFFPRPSHLSEVPAPNPEPVEIETSIEVVDRAQGRFEMVEVLRLRSRTSLPDQLKQIPHGSAQTQLRAIVHMELVRANQRESGPNGERWFYVFDRTEETVVWKVAGVGASASRESALS